MNSDRDAFAGIAVRGMQQDLGWDHAAYMYEQKLLEAKYAHRLEASFEASTNERTGIDE